MKLNKKGFGVAEIAIVILLIGILAAAVIAGFMGIKKNAHDAVDSQQKFAETMDHELKHTFPTILSDDLTTGLSIGEGQYEVYEMAGYNILNGGKGSNVYPINNKGTLYVKGVGTLDRNSIINGNFSAKQGGRAIANYGTLVLDDLIVIGGYGERVYPVAGYTGSKTTLNNVICEGSAGIIYIEGEKTELTINGTNSQLTFIVLPYFSNNGGVTGRNAVWVAQGAKLTINDGVVNIKRDSNTYAWIELGTIVINGGEFKSTSNQNGFTFAYNDPTKVGTGELIINNGIFNCKATKGGFLNFAGTPAKVTISGGLFNCNKSSKPFMNFGSGTAEVTILGGEFIEYTDNAKFKSGTGSGSVVISGGAFAVKPKAEWIAEGSSISAEKQPVVCKDGVTRNLWVVTKN